MTGDTPRPRGGLTSLEEAWRVVVQAARAHREGREEPVREVELWEAPGAVLAADVLADRDQPPFHRSAMDGYAVRSADVAGESASLRLVGEVPAGTVYEGRLQAGETVAIMTGAPLPAGADAVQMQERCRADGDRVVVGGPVSAGMHIARQGEDVRAGQPVARAGQVVTPLLAGVLASVGQARVAIVRPPRARVVATGDELVEIEEAPAPWQIRDSNRYTLLALLGQAGFKAADGGRVPDRADDLRLAVRAGLQNDVLLLSGGVSAGRYDLVAEVLADEGVERLVHKVAIKPGKPIYIGRHPGGLVLGLPGNPVSTYVTALLFALPALATIAGRDDALPWTMEARLAGELPATGDRVTFHPGRLACEPDGLVVRTVPWNGSGDQVGFAAHTCLVRRDAGAPAAGDGARVKVVLARPPIEA